MAVDSVNEVLLVGRLSAEPELRALPSGDELTTWRLIVDRVGAPACPSGPRTPTVDTIDCVAHKPSLRRVAARWVAGDLLEVRGALRRRFWRAPHGPASRNEVEVASAKKVGGRPTTAVS